VGWGGEGDTGVGGPDEAYDEAHQEHAVSDRRRGRGTIRAAFMDNGAPHLESYNVDESTAILHHVLGLGVLDEAQGSLGISNPNAVAASKGSTPDSLSPDLEGRCGSASLARIPVHPRRRLKCLSPMARLLR